LQEETALPSTTNYEEFAYDANGNGTSWRCRNTATITYCYDNLNRTLRENVSGVSCSSGGQSAEVIPKTNVSTVTPTLSTLGSGYFKPTAAKSPAVNLRFVARKLG
jgi:hypothetical protein